MGLGPKGVHIEIILGLRGVVVANSIDDVYKMKEVIGEGQTATVIEGVRLSDGKPYALKAFRTAGAGADVTEGLREEVEILRAIPAWNI